MNDEATTKEKPVVDGPREEELKETAMLESGPQTLHGIHLRGFSAGDVKLCKKMKLAVIVGSEDESKKMLVQDLIDEVAALAWLLNIPSNVYKEHGLELPDEVLLDLFRHKRQQVDDGSWKEGVEDFQAMMDLGQIQAIFADVTKMAAQAGAAIFALSDRDDEAESEEPPGN